MYRFRKRALFENYADLTSDLRCAANLAVPHPFTMGRMA